jgi:hypothetical protein
MHVALGNFALYQAAAHRAYPQDKAFFDAASLASSIIAERGLLHKGFGVCHGISGNGFALLSMYRCVKF